MLTLAATICGCSSPDGAAKLDADSRAPASASAADRRLDNASASASVSAPTNPQAQPNSSASASSGSPIQFRDVTARTGIEFRHCSGNDPQKHFPTSLGSGVALLDCDGDGWLDIYLATTRNLPRSEPNASQGNRLFRNLGGWRFEDVTESSGAGAREFCHGAAVGDVNNDGKPDLYLTCLGGNRLLINETANGAIKFRDVSQGSGAECGLWSSGAAFLDYDRDGVLDLYVSCYGKWKDTDPHPYCGDEKRGLRVICSPFSIQPERHFLYKGRGDGTFIETTKAAGVYREDGRGLGVVAADVDLNGWIDLYVANDGCPNFLFLNQGGGRFEDVTQTSGAAYDETGQVQGSMGVDIEDVDGDGWPELFTTNFRGQYNTLYQNLSGKSFQDVSARAGLVRDSRLYVGWGCALADFNLDGAPDLFVVNGEVDDNLRSFGQENDYEQPAKVWIHRGGLRFETLARPGPFFEKNHPARGAAFGDIDNDGDLDAVVSRMDQNVAVLSNESPNLGHWVRLELQAATSNRSAIGAVVTVRIGDRILKRQRKGGDSYLSANDPRLLIGVGSADRVDRVEIVWPNGARSELRDLQTGRSHRAVEP